MALQNSRTSTMSNRLSPRSHLLDEGLSLTETVRDIFLGQPSTFAAVSHKLQEKHVVV